MAAHDFPTTTLDGLEDSKHFTVAQADPAKSADVEGGYRITRPWYTRLPRKTWTTGFTDLTDTEKDSFTDFWDEQFGGSDSFIYLNPADAVNYTVRFKGLPKIKYTGMAALRLWEISGIILEQV